MLRKLRNDVAIYGGVDLLFRLTQFIVIPFYAHLLSVADFGIMALLSVTATLIGMLLNLGVNNSVQRFYFEAGADPDDRSLLVTTGLAQLLLSGAIITLVALVILTVARDAIRYSYAISWPLILIVLFTALPEQVSQYCLDATRLQFAPLKFFAIHIVKNLLGVLLGFWFLLRWHMGIGGVLLGTLAGAAAAVPIGLLMIRRDLAWRFDWAVARKIFSYGHPFVLAGMAFWVFGSMDRWMLMALSDATQVGLFSIGMKFAAVITFVISAFAQAWSPFAMRMHAEDSGYRQGYAKIFSLWFFLLAGIGLGLALFAQEFLTLLTPPEYWGAAPVLAIGAAGLVLYGTVQITVLGITLERRTHLLSYGAWLAAGVNVVLNIALIPRFGAVGAAVSTICAYALLSSSFLVWSQRLHPIPLERSKLLYSVGLVAASLLTPVALAPLGTGLVAILVKVAILLAVVAGAFAVGVIDPDAYRKVLHRARS
jgi:O-antigen/teichoic acid export membrane protein